MGEAIEEDSRKIATTGGGEDDVEDKTLSSSPPPPYTKASPKSQSAAFSASEMTSFEVKAEPQVSLSISRSDTDEVSGGTIVVEYTLQDGVWDDDDAVLLISCLPPMLRKQAKNQGDESYLFHEEEVKRDKITKNTVLCGYESMYNPGEIDAGDAYENFMYTEEPVVVGFDYRNSDKTSGNHSNPLNSPLQGQVSLRLPKYSGWFAVCYVRTVTNLVSSGEDKLSRESGRSYSASLCLLAYLPHCLVATLA